MPTFASAGVTVPPLNDYPGLLCYAGDGSIHLTVDLRTTRCGRSVYDSPEVPRYGTAPLSCDDCHAAAYRRATT